MDWLEFNTNLSSLFMGWTTNKNTYCDVHYIFSTWCIHVQNVFPISEKSYFLFPKYRKKVYCIIHQLEVLSTKIIVSHVCSIVYSYVHNYIHVYSRNKSLVPYISYKLLSTENNKLYCLFNMLKLKAQNNKTCCDWQFVLYQIHVNTS